jgi:hypothetical protein
MPAKDVTPAVTYGAAVFPIVVQGQVTGDRSCGWVPACSRDQKFSI